MHINTYCSWYIMKEHAKQFLLDKILNFFYFYVFFILFIRPLRRVIFFNFGNTTIFNVVVYECFFPWDEAVLFVSENQNDMYSFLNFSPGPNSSIRSWRKSMILGDWSRIYFGSVWSIPFAQGDIIEREWKLDRFSIMMKIADRLYYASRSSTS